MKKMNRRHKKAVRVIFLAAILMGLCTIVVFAEGETGGKDIFQLANDIIRKVYTSIAGISTVLAGLMTAIAAIAAKISNNQQRTDQAVDWIKRIWVCWAVINSIGAILAYIVPLFDGFATLPE